MVTGGENRDWVPIGQVDDVLPPNGGVDYHSTMMNELKFSILTVDHLANKEPSLFVDVFRARTLDIVVGDVMPGVSPAPVQSRVLTSIPLKEHPVRLHISNDAIHSSSHPSGVPLPNMLLINAWAVDGCGIVGA